MKSIVSKNQALAALLAVALVVRIAALILFPSLDDADGFLPRFDVLGSRLIKSTIREQRRGKQRPNSFAPICRNALRCA
jgi:hypothetical protein